MIKRNQHGFTIVELVVTLAIIGILVAIGITSYSKVQSESQDNKRASDMTILRSNLDAFYQDNGVYPPGCPQTSCASWFHTENTASAIITQSTTIQEIRDILPSVPEGWTDPDAPKNTPPIMNVGASTIKYFYYGGMANNRTFSSSLSVSSTAYFPCTINQALSPGEAGSYVAGYYNESTQQWMLYGGKYGRAMTISGPVANGCVIIP